MLVREKRALDEKELRQARAAVNTEPTPGQIEAGNYAKGHVSWAGFGIAIENPKGSERSGTDRNGKTWSITMANDYGYFKGILGRDKDHLDVFIGPHLESELVHVVNQNAPATGKFDEHKCIIDVCRRTKHGRSIWRTTRRAGRVSAA
jgi:hypothetical protein